MFANVVQIKRKEMSNEKSPVIPDKLIAYASNSSVHTVKAVRHGKRNDRRGIATTRQKVQHYLHTLRKQSNK